MADDAEMTVEQYFTIGDYDYDPVYSDNGVNVRVNDPTKTSYADIPSTVTYEDVQYTVIGADYCFSHCENLLVAPTIPNSVRYMNGCFESCTSLTTPPTIPANVTDMYECFMLCTSLTTPPTIPSGVTNMTSCFAGCSSLATAPTIPNSVYNLGDCFESCTSLTTPPTIPSGVVEMSWCFFSCTSLTTAPAIPSTVKRMEECFKNCISLGGNVVVSRSASSNGIFDGTTNQIFIVPNNLSDVGATSWRKVAAKYANVHYYLDDLAPIVLNSFTAVRVATSGSTTRADDTGTYAYLLANYTHDDTCLPDGMTRTVTKTLKRDNVTASPSWTNSSIGISKTSKAWMSQTVATSRTYSLTISDNFGNSSTLTVTLSKVAALLDFHSGGDGLAIGTVSTGAGLEVAMPSNFDDSVNFADTVKYANTQAYPLFIWSTAPTASSTFPISPCFVYCTANNGLYYCTN